MRTRLPTVDAAVIAAARRGERDAHAELYRLFATPCFTLARRILGSASLAEDALHEAFVEIIRAIPGYRGDAAVGTWITRIVINKCLAYLRSGWESRRSDTDADRALAPVAGSFDDQLALERALDALPDVARAIVWLHDVEGFTHNEIAKLMGKTESFSKSQLSRAHERLRSLLHGETNEGKERDPECIPMTKPC